MLRTIIHINEETCNGCGACAAACHEGAIGMIAGKARLLPEDYCDGLGDCLPACPTGAITFTQREAAAYDEAAVQAAKGERAAEATGCPGMRSGSIAQPVCACAGPAAEAPSRLSQWPVQLKLAPVSAPYYHGAELLVAADCTAYAYAAFHTRFIQGHITLVGCPKLDGVDYAEKLTAILRENDVRSVTVTRMEVPCCGGLTHAVRSALHNCGKQLPLQVVTISTDGKIVQIEEG